MTFIASARPDGLVSMTRRWRSRCRVPAAVCSLGLLLGGGVSLAGIVSLAGCGSASSDDQGGAATGGGAASSASGGGGGGGGGGVGTGGRSGGGAGGTALLDSGMPQDGGMTMGCVGQGDTYVAGLTKAGERGQFSLVLVESTPSVRGAARYVWTVKVLDANGTALSGATVVATPFMPAMGHGTAPDPTTTELGSGVYTLDPVNLFMEGLWEVRIDISAGGVTDRVVVAFCLTGSAAGTDAGMTMTGDAGAMTHDMSTM